jgi:hypothetical protein
MKNLLIISFILYFINCKGPLSINEVTNLEYYINYTLIPPVGVKVKTYYFEPNYEVGTVDFVMYFSNRALFCTFKCFDGNTLIDNFTSGYLPYKTHTLAIPSSRPSILRLEVTNYNHEDPYYLYMYNKNYVIQLQYPNYYLYQISLKDLKINYMIKDLNEDMYLKLEAKIEYPQYKDKINIIIKDEENEYNNTFDETSSFTFELNKNKKYSLIMSPEFNSIFTNNTYFFLTFEKEQNFPLLFYKNNNLEFTTILSNNKWYIIDSINSIDNYNHYNFSIIEGYQDNSANSINIRIKRYPTYNIEYIKNNLPGEYDENYILNVDSFAFKSCQNASPYDKTVLIYLELNYYSKKSSLYKYSFRKIIQNKPIEFKSYDIKWYTNYEFNSTNVQNKDIIFISTNHSNTVHPQSSGKYKAFDSFYKGYLFVSYLNEDINKNQVKIIYSDEFSKIENDNDIGHLEIFKFDNEKMSFDIINIDELIESKIYSYEIMRNCDKYF